MQPWRHTRQLSIHISSSSVRLPFVFLRRRNRPTKSGIPVNDLDFIDDFVLVSVIADPIQRLLSVAETAAVFLKLMFNTPKCKYIVDKQKRFFTSFL